MPSPGASSPIRILLANHQPIIRSGLRLLLEREPDFQIIAEAANGTEARVLAEYKRPAITLLEIKPPEINGISVAKELLASRHPPKIIFVTAHTDVEYVIEAFKAGAQGYVSADSATSDLTRAIRYVTRGELYVSPVVCAKLQSGPIDRESLPDSLSHYLSANNCTIQKP